jgi:hypothetical protein
LEPGSHRDRERDRERERDRGSGMNKHERRRLFEAQVKAHDELASEAQLRQQHLQFLADPEYRAYLQNHGYDIAQDLGGFGPAVDLVGMQAQFPPDPAVAAVMQAYDPVIQQGEQQGSKAPTSIITTNHQSQS